MIACCHRGKDTRGIVEPLTEGRDRHSMKKGEIWVKSKRNSILIGSKQIQVVYKEVKSRLRRGPRILFPCKLQKSDKRLCYIVENGGCLSKSKRPAGLVLQARDGCCICTGKGSSSRVSFFFFFLRKRKDFKEQNFSAPCPSC